MRSVRTAWLLPVLAWSVTLASGQSPTQRQVGEMTLTGIPPWDDSLRTRMLQYLQSRSSQLQSIRDDGRGVLVRTRFGDTAQLHVVETPLGMRRQVTFFDEPVRGWYVPHAGGRQLIFAKDQAGNEETQLFRLNLDTGHAALLTDGQSRHGPPTFSKSGRWLAFTGNARNQSDFDVFLHDLSATDRPRLIWQVDGMYQLGGFSPDEARLLATQYVSAHETHCFVRDIQSEQQAQVTPDAPPTFYGDACWSADGRAIYLTSDRGGEFRKLYVLDFEYGHWRCLTADCDWDITAVAVDPAGSGIAFVSNEDGVSRLYLADAWGNGRRPVDGLPTGTFSDLSFAADGGTLGLTVSAACAPADTYTVSFTDAKVTRWTASELGGLNPDTFVEPHLVRYPTFDTIDGKTRTIPAFVYPGRGDGPRPVVIYAHGGPEGQFLPTFHATIQYWAVELGITVIAPNIRGSTGYGRSFHLLDDGPRRTDAVKDIGALLDWISQQTDLDTERVGIFGGSYGGYIVLASLATYQERFKAGVDLAGIADFITFLERTGEYRRDLRRAEYGDERDPTVHAFLEEISPLRQADKIEAALLILHGQNDPRVPVSEAEQIVTKLRSLGRPVWYALAHNEGHGFRKKANRDLAAVLYAAFWQEHLLK
ncbi:MAG: alpha/beta fold hydrolase [Planctomycetes bacterium]|nr:alpha/beta fold hydrolase [Planctomycetota bacterium]